MEAVGALGRVRPHSYLEAMRTAVRSRSRAFWIVAGLTVLAAALRFATLGLQAYHHDEIVTASRLLRGSFWHAMDAVGFSESAPPLYYALAWVWTQFTGTAEFGLRSFSAAAGVATVPVAYLIARELKPRSATPHSAKTRSAVPSPRMGGRRHSGTEGLGSAVPSPRMEGERNSAAGGGVHRVGVFAAALVAVNPMLVWYSQEGRAYALLILLAALSFLYFVRALRGGRRDLVLWGAFSGLALATHYFAVFPVAAEAAWLLWRRRRAALAGLGIVAGFVVALAPLVVLQMSYEHADWISNFTLSHRLADTALGFTIGETGDIIAQTIHPSYAFVPLLCLGVGLGLVLVRGEADERRGAALPLAIGSATIATPLLLAVVVPGKDYLLARNLLPALVPLLIAVAIGLGLRRARRVGAAIAVVLVAYWLGFSLWASLSPSMQRPDWDAVATELGEPDTPRAMVTWTIGEAPLRYYLSTGSIQARASEGFGWWVGEVDFISDGPAPPPGRHLLAPGLRAAGLSSIGRLQIRRYVTPGPGLVRLRMRDLRQAELGFRSNGVLLDGIGPG